MNWIDDVDVTVEVNATICCTFTVSNIYIFMFCLRLQLIYIFHYFSEVISTNDQFIVTIVDEELKIALTEIEVTPFNRV